MAEPIRTYRLSDKDYQFVKEVFDRHGIKLAPVITDALLKKAIELDLKDKVEGKK